jgi:hypothetical protein
MVTEYIFYSNELIRTLNYGILFFVPCVMLYYIIRFCLSCFNDKICYEYLKKIMLTPIVGIFCQLLIAGCLYFINVYIDLYYKYLNITYDKKY